MNLTVEVWVAFRQFWSARLVIDGVSTSFDCGHNHKNGYLAAKCMPKVLASAVKITSAEGFSERVVKSEFPDDLIEWGWTHKNGLQTTRRFWTVR